MTIYPSGIDSSLQLPTVAGVSSEATAINALQSAVIAIETELGVNPRGIYSDVETRLSIIEARLGPGPVITGGPIDIDDAILSGTLSIPKGGTGLNSIGAANTILISNGVGLFYDFITNDNIDSAASIDGTKIVPDFGDQDIISTGDIYISSVIFGSGGPSITQGAGVPSSSQPNGSLFLRTDGTAATGVYTRQGGSWAVLGSGLVATAGGSDTQVQFNDGGLVNGDSGFTYNKSTNILSISDAIAIGTAPASLGALRLSSDEYIYARDGNPGVSDVKILGFNSLTGEVEISTGTYDIRLFPGNSRTIYHQSTTHQFYGGNGITDLLRMTDSRFGTSGIDEWTTNQDTKGTERTLAPKNTQTTDATPTSVGSFTLPANSTACVVSWLVGCITDDATAAGGYSVTALFLQDSGGTVNLVGSPNVTTIGETLSGCAATAVTDGTSVSLEITGVAATNITWSWIRTSLEVIP